MRNTFRILAIRAPKVRKEETPENRRKAALIQKRLYGDDSWRYFCNDVTILVDDDFDLSDTILFEGHRTQSSRIYDLDNIHVEVSAIVGKNGTGKSTIVDLLIRTINNLAAATIGETYEFEAAEHLHYIENVYSDLCVEISDQIYIIEMRGRKVILHLYTPITKGSTIYQRAESIPILSESSDPAKFLTPNPKAQGQILPNFFYTLVCNYSLYSFNYRDYEDEQTPEVRLKAIYRDAEKTEKWDRNISAYTEPEDSIWLKGLFYKNDGYQTPIVIHPMRHDGMIDINREHELSKERLLKTFFYKNEKGAYPLRTINQNLHVHSVKLTRMNLNYGNVDEVASRLRITAKQNIYRNYQLLGNCIIEFWNEKYKLWQSGRQIDFESKEAARNYIIYKTIKIVSTYPQYKGIRTLMRASNPDMNEIHNRLENVYKDNSHRTRKLRRAIYYLLDDVYDSQGVYPLNVLTTRIKNAMMNHATDKFSINMSEIGQVDSYLPPPMFDWDFILSKEDCNTIEFRNLSSGEKQIAYTLSSFLYHVTNVESVRYASRLDILKYRYMTVIFDEVEQYYHPDLQRRFLSYLLEGLSCIDFKGIKCIHIIMATHSPFILSDIPRNNILALRDKNDTKTTMAETFCGNINDMLDHPFFMDYTVGEVAREKIEEIIDLYESAVENHQVLPTDIAKRMKRYRYIANLIGDSYIRDSIKEMLKRIKQRVEGV